jgi:recombination protein RecA
LDVEKINKQISKLLKFSTFEPEYRYWLDTKFPPLNDVFGSKDKGLPYGKLFELSGLEHGGKTAIALVLAGIARRDGAGVGYIDLEDSRDMKWAGKLGLDLTNVSLHYPKLVYEGKKKDKPPRLQSAEEIFTEAEMAMEQIAAQGFDKQFWIVDSIANIVPLKMVEAGVIGANMNTKVSRADFLSTILPQWAGLAANRNATILFINQLRQKIGLVFGDPWDTTGGRALRTNCAVRNRVRRLKGGQMKNNGKVVGIVGIIKNMKNKAGEESVEGEECGFSIRWDKSVADVKFTSVDETSDMLGGSDDT